MTTMTTACRPKIVVARSTDDPWEVMRLIRSSKADGVAAEPAMISQLKEMKDFITKKPQLDGKLQIIPLTSMVTLGEAAEYLRLPLTVMITGTRTHNPSGVVEARPLRVGLTDNGPGTKKCFTIIDGGVTGYESVHLTRAFIDSSSKRGWSACWGGMGWDKLEISAAEMACAHEELNSNVYANETD